MILFPNCKMNLGLRVTARRPDGYHDIETVMFPVRGLCDALEILPSAEDDVSFSSSGLSIDGPPEQNLCLKAYRLMREHYGIGGVKMHLHKHIPHGAGLGGGSSDAVFTLKMLDALFGLGLPEEELEKRAAELGSDTVFFIKNQPALATGRGEVLTPFEVNLKGYYLMLVKPELWVSTADAYQHVKPRIPEVPLQTLIHNGIHTWKECLTNDFEPSVFLRHPELADIKRQLYDQGALYAAMSGSGSTIFGLFEKDPQPIVTPRNCFVYIEKML